MARAIRKQRKTTAASNAQIKNDRRALRKIAMRKLKRQIVQTIKLAKKKTARAVLKATVKGAKEGSRHGSRAAKKAIAKFLRSRQGKRLRKLAKAKRAAEPAASELMEEMMAADSQSEDSPTAWVRDDLDTLKKNLGRDKHLSAWAASWLKSAAEKL